MTMTIDPNQQRFAAFDQMSYQSQPHFTNPWASSTAGSQPQGMYVSSQHDGSGMSSLSLGGVNKHAQPTSVPRTGTASSATLAPYASIPVTAASAGSPLMVAGLEFGTQDSLSLAQDHQLLGLSRMPPHQSTSGGYDASYATASPVHPSYPATTAAPTSYDMGYAPAPVRGTFALAPAPDAADPSRRYSQTSVPSSSSSSSAAAAGGSLFDSVSPVPAPAELMEAPSQSNQLVNMNSHHSGLQTDDRRAFADALEASHGMLSMSQDTPRNIYGPAARGRGSADSYGFPSAHSTSSSVSSNGFGSYYAGSVDSSVSDYSTAGSDIESVTGGRTLPRPSGLMAGTSHGAPPAPQSMMGQFSSKVTSSSQKKHKCKVCDKRFTRPSSLQTHMYSHTGEKPFCCDVEGCGRHFSVVSNLRRHRKVHKGQSDAPSEAGSEDHHSDD